MTPSFVTLIGSWSFQLTADFLYRSWASIADSVVPLIRETVSRIFSSGDAAARRCLRDSGSACKDLVGVSLAFWIDLTSWERSSES